MTVELPVWVAVAFATVWEILTAPTLWLGLLVAAWVVWRWGQGGGLRPKTASFAIPFMGGGITFDVTRPDREVAWKLYVQFVTRKAAVPFDEEHDVIKEVFDSLFELFRESRSLLLELPTDVATREEGVASLVIRVLNGGVRPVLTRWQADFRAWWDAALADNRNAGRSPQEIQRDYPKYDDLVSSIAEMNTELSKFADELLALAHPRQPARRPKRVRPLPPSQSEAALP